MIEIKTEKELRQYTKKDIIHFYIELSNEYDELDSQYNDLNDYATEQENAAYDYMKEIEKLKKYNKEKTIIDIDSMIKRLKLNDLYTEELDEFFDEYMKFYNERS